MQTLVEVLGAPLSVEHLCRYWLRYILDMHTLVEVLGAPLSVEQLLINALKNGLENPIFQKGSSNNPNNKSKE